MFNRFNQHRERRKKGEFRSKLEGEISQALQQQGLDIDYEKDRFDFYLKRFYTPDFRVKGKAFDFWIEVKGYWPAASAQKCSLSSNGTQHCRSSSRSSARTNGSTRRARPRIASGARSTAWFGAPPLSPMTSYLHG